MTRDEYMEAHHHITESYLGLVRVALYRKDVKTAEHYLYKCSRELDKIFELRKDTIIGEEELVDEFEN